MLFKKLMLFLTLPPHPVCAQVEGIGQPSSPRIRFEWRPSCTTSPVFSRPSPSVWLAPRASHALSSACRPARPVLTRTLGSLYKGEICVPTLGPVQHAHHFRHAPQSCKTRTRARQTAHEERGWTVNSPSTLLTCACVAAAVAGGLCGFY